MCQTHIQRTKEDFTCVTLIQIALKYVFIFPHHLHYLSGSLYFKICFQNSNKKAYTCVRLAMMIWVLIKMAMVPSELAISEKEKKWFKLVRGKSIQTSVTSQILTLSGVEPTSFQGIKFSKNENFLPDAAQTH